MEQVAPETELALKDIREKIAELTTIKGDRELLKNGIRSLQKALVENPAACAIMLPEDIGSAVELIRIYVGKEVQEEAAKKATSKRTVSRIDLSPEALDKLLDEEL